MKQLISIGGWIGIGIGILFVLLIVFFIAWWIRTYNKLIEKRNRVKNSWAQIDVQLKRRFDLVPNILETVKGYAAHEKEILLQFAEARKLYTSSSQEGDVEGVAKASSQLNKLVTMTMERYPELKADAQFISLQNVLKDSEDKIAFTRQFYNDVVMDFNNLREKFPSSFVANVGGFKEAKLFQIEDEAQREAPKVSF